MNTRKANKKKWFSLKIFALIITLPVLLFGLINILIFYFRMPVEQPKINSNNIVSLSAGDSSQVEQKLKSLSLEEKCGQLLMPALESFSDDTTTRQYKKMYDSVKKIKVGGFVLFKSSAKEHIHMVNKIQKFSEIPLLISGDYETGLNMRIKDATQFPYNMALAATRNPDLAYRYGLAVGAECRAMGIHINFAPLLDINNDYRNPVIDIRSYSESPEIVSNFSISFMQGMYKNRVIGVAKHFPGHGATDTDSHNSLPVIRRNESQMYEFELKPFRRLIRNGLNAIMVGHLSIPAIENEKLIPATLSENMITKLLKNKMGFRGLIFTDAMNMQAITKEFGNDRATIMAIKAGNDIILYPGNVERSFKAITNAVKAGEISEERIDQSVRKILILKKFLSLDNNRFIEKNKALDIINNHKHKLLAKEIAEKSVTLVKDDERLIPLSEKDYKKIVSIAVSDKQFENSPLFQDLIKNRFKNSRIYQTKINTSENEFSKLLKSCNEADLIILPLYIYSYTLAKHNTYFKNLTVFLHDLFKLKKKMIVISFGTPYIYMEMPNIKTLLFAYGQQEVSQNAVYEAIVGNENITGVTPVSFPGRNITAGYGLKRWKIKTDTQKDKYYNFAPVDSLMTSAVQIGIFPGAQLLVQQNDRILYNKTFGNYTYEKKSPKVTFDTKYDLASLTKVIVTTTAAMILCDRGQLKLDEKIINYLPALNKNKKEITVRNLLLHNSGLPAFEPFYKKYNNQSQVLDHIYNCELNFKPGQKVQYSDWGMIILQKIIEKITGEPLDRYINYNLFSVIGMNNSFYNPSDSEKKKCAPTENDTYWRNRQIQGEVHDETAALLGGVSGNAGLFSTSEDISKFLYLMINGGKSGNYQVIRSATIEDWTSRQLPDNSRALGWDTNFDKNSSCGTLFSPQSFGHTGFTGTSVWVDKKRKLFVVLLTNRVFPARDNQKLFDFRKKIHDSIIRQINY